MRLIRNPGENVTESAGFTPCSLTSLLSSNFRIAEVATAIALEQPRRLNALKQVRTAVVNYLDERRSRCPGLTMPAVRRDCPHVHYLHTMEFLESAARFLRDTFVRALTAEGTPIRGGYVRPLYLEPLYQKRIATGDERFPFYGSHHHGTVSYAKRISQVEEDLYETKTLINILVYHPLASAELDDVVASIDKVFARADHLQD